MAHSHTPLPACAALPCAAGLIAALNVYQRRRRKDLMGRVLPPGAGPDTTFVVVKVQVRAGMMCTVDDLRALLQALIA